MLYLSIKIVGKPELFAAQTRRRPRSTRLIRLPFSLLGVLQLGLFLGPVGCIASSSGTGGQVRGDALANRGETTPAISQDRRNQLLGRTDAVRQPVESQRQPSAAAVYAEPISPGTVKRFPHLLEFSGHVVLGNSEVQIILPGLGADPVARDWDLAVLAILVKDARSQWVHFPLIESIEAQPSGKSPPLRPTGYDFAVDPADQHAVVTKVFETASRPAGRRELNFLVGKNGLSFRAAANASEPNIPQSFKGRMTRTLAPAVAWNLRIKSGAEGGLLAVPSQRTVAQPPKGKATAHRSKAAPEGSLYSYLQKSFGPDQFGVLPMAPVQLRQERDQFDVMAGGAAEWRGVEFLLGDEATGKLYARASSLTRCLGGAKGKPRNSGEGEQGAVACLDEGSSAGVYLSLSVPPGGESGLSEAVQVTTLSGQPLLRFRLQAGRAQFFAQPKGDLEALAVGPEGRSIVDERAAFTELPRSQAEAPAASASQEVSVTPGGTTAVAIQRLAPSNQETATLVSIKRLDALDRFIDTPAVQDPAKVLRLGAGFFLVDAWPAKVALTPGHYQVELSDVRSGIYCSYAMKTHVVSKDLQVECAAPPAAQTSGWQGTTTVGFGLGLLPHFWQPWAAVFGYDALIHDLPPVQKAAAADTLALGLSAFEIKDPDTQLQVMVIGTTGPTFTFAERWRKFQTSPTRIDGLPAFSEFVRKEFPEGMIVVGCPARQQKPDEYFEMVRMMAPDAVQVFGCEGSIPQNELLAGMGRLVAKTGRPTAMAAASVFSARDALKDVPVMILAGSSGRQNAEDLLRRLKDGRFTVATGSALRVDFHDEGKPPAVSAGRRPVAFDVRLRLAPNLKPTVLELVSPRGERFGRLPLTLADVESVKLFKAALPKQTNWVRLELRGQDAAAEGKSARDFVLATTNFFSLDQPKEQKSE